MVFNIYAFIKPETILLYGVNEEDSILEKRTNQEYKKGNPVLNNDSYKTNNYI